MIDRYLREEIKHIWDLHSKFDYYLKVEIAVCEAYAELGEIPKEDVLIIKQRAKFDVKRIDEIEREVRHDVIAFLTNVNESLGDLGRYMHVGLTSSDVIDTAFALQIKKKKKIIKQDLNKVINSIKNLAEKHKNTIFLYWHLYLINRFYSTNQKQVSVLQISSNICYNKSRRPKKYVKIFK